MDLRSRFVAEISGEAREMVARLLEEEVSTPDALREMVRRYASDVRALAVHRPFLDVDLSDRIALGCEGLIDGFSDAADAFRLVHVVCRYYVLAEDDDGDLGSVMGFDDDAEVFDAAVTALGRPDLRLDT